MSVMAAPMLADRRRAVQPVYPPAILQAGGARSVESNPPKMGGNPAEFDPPVWVCRQSSRLASRRGYERMRNLRGDGPDGGDVHAELLLAGLDGNGRRAGRG